MKKTAKDWKESRFLPKSIAHAPARGKCKWCQEELPPRKRSFCSPPCVHEWLLRTSNSYLRGEVFKRDKGVCVECQKDAHKIGQELRKLPAEEKALRISEFELTEKQAARSLWEADHVLGVAEGGGCSGLSNIQTLCIWCHRKKTKAAAKKRAVLRSSSK